MDALTPWYVPVARAVPAIVVAVVVTFSADHSPTLGYLTFGAFAVASGGILVAAALRAAARGIDRALTLAQGLLGVIAGVVALALPAGGLPFLVFLVTAFAALTGFLELYLGMRGRRRAQGAGDRLFVGGLTVLLAIVVLLVPPEYVEAFTGPDGVERALTASIIVVGVLGAYWAILAVYLVIAGFSLKWSPAPAAATTPGEA